MDLQYYRNQHFLHKKDGDKHYSLQLQHLRAAYSQKLNLSSYANLLIRNHIPMPEELKMDIEKEFLNNSKTSCNPAFRPKMRTTNEMVYQLK